MTASPALASGNGGGGGSGSSGGSGSHHDDDRGGDDDDDRGGDDDDDNDGGDDDDENSVTGNSDQSRALNAVRNNEAASLRQIMSIVSASQKGEIVHVDLKGTGKNLTYHFRILDPSSRLIDVEINATNLNVVVPAGS